MCVYMSLYMCACAEANSRCAICRNNWNVSCLPVTAFCHTMCMYVYIYIWLCVVCLSAPIFSSACIFNTNYIFCIATLSLLSRRHIILASPLPNEFSHRFLPIPAPAVWLTVYLSDWLCDFVFSVICLVVQKIVLPFSSYAKMLKVCKCLVYHE